MDSSLNDLTLNDADSTYDKNDTQTSSSTELAKEAMDRSASDSDPPVQVASPRLHLNPVIAQRLSKAMRKYEIPKEEIRKLYKLKDFEIVFICDDSGSMNTPLKNSQQTRWDILRGIVEIAVEFGTIFDSNGIDIHFLNRPEFHRITDPKQIEPLFRRPPSGYTPLTTVLKKVLNMPAARRGHDKKLLIFIATDGEPTDDHGNSDLQHFEHVMHSERQSETTHVMFLICTDEAAPVNYLKKWDRKMVNVDIIDTFDNERLKVMNKYKNSYAFPMANYIMKILLGAIDNRFDQIND
ncbi:hypothetical protein I4U23_000166 [Adineta vaga]|nr:hypothetical protein I4U23_000166 [Adineta vaga]